VKIEKFLDSNPFAIMAIVTQEIDRSIRADLMDEGLTFMQALALVSIFFEDGKAAHPKDMAETFGMTKSNLSHLLNKLQEMKLVTRKVHAEDFRRQQVSLTVLGEKTCQRLIRYFNRMQDRLEESFGDAESLKRFNKKIRALSEMN